MALTPQQIKDQEMLARSRAKKAAAINPPASPVQPQSTLDKVGSAISGIKDLAKSTYDKITGNVPAPTKAQQTFIDIKNKKNAVTTNPTPTPPTPVQPKTITGSDPGLTSSAPAPKTTQKKPEKLDPNQFTFGEKAKEVEKQMPGYIAQRNQAGVQAIMADPTLTDANTQQKVIDYLNSMGADKMQADPTDVAKTVKNMTDMIAANRKNVATDTTLSTQSATQIGDALANGQYTADELATLRATDPAKYDAAMKRKQQVDAANQDNATVSGETYQGIEVPEAPSYEDLMKEAGIGESSINMDEEYKKIYTPELTGLKDNLNKYDKELALLNEQKFNLKDDIIKRLQGTGATDRTVNLMLYDESEGIDKQIRTATIQRDSAYSDYKDKSSTADAQRKAIQDQVKTKDDQKRKVFEAKYGMAKDEYNKQRNMFEKKVARVEKLADIADERKYDFANEDYRRKVAQEDKIQLMGLDTDKQMKVAEFKANLDKKSGGVNVMMIPNSDGSHSFVDKTKMKVVGILGSDGRMMTNDPSTLPTSGSYVTETLGGRKVKLAEVAMPALKIAADQLKQAGLSDLIYTQGHRSSEEQKVLYEKSQKGEIGLVAKPGTSKHETGMAIDIYSGKNAKGQLMPPTPQQTKILNANGRYQTAGAADMGHFEYTGKKKIVDIGKVAESNTTTVDPTTKVITTTTTKKTKAGEPQTMDELLKKFVKGESIKSDIESGKFGDNADQVTSNLSEMFAKSIPQAKEPAELMKPIERLYKMEKYPMYSRIVPALRKTQTPEITAQALIRKSTKTNMAENIAQMMKFDKEGMGKFTKDQRIKYIRAAGIEGTVSPASEWSWTKDEERIYDTALKAYKSL